MRALVLLGMVLLFAGSSSAAVSDVSISVSESISSSGAPPGGTVSVSFSAMNSGSTDQTPFSLVLFLGQHWTVGAPPAGCSRPDPYDIDCEFAGLAGGASTPSFSVTLTIDADAQPGWILDSRVFAFPGGTSGAGLGSDAKSIQVSAAAAASGGGGGGGGGGSGGGSGGTPPPAPAPTLSVALHGGGSGSVASSPDGVSCGATCAATFPAGASVTLTATPSAGSVFAGWGDGCAAAAANAQCTVTLSANTAVSASFDLAPVAPPPPPVVCMVPALHGLTLAAVKSRLAHAHCRLGQVASRVSPTILVGRVLTQRPAAGGHLSNGGKVAVVLGKRR